ncbi:MAG: hypothetical protein AB7T49_06120 [Oligoflexales bacterium]
MKTQTLLIATVGLMIACGNESETKSTRNNGTPKSTSQSLLGTFETGCLNDADDAGSQKTVITFADGEYLTKVEAFEFSNCSHKNVIIEQGGMYLQRGSEIQVTTSGLLYTFLDPRAIDYANESKFCGRSDWKVNQQLFVNSSDCGEGANQISTANYRFDGNKLLLTSEGETLELYRRK